MAKIAFEDLYYEKYCVPGMALKELIVAMEHGLPPRGGYVTFITGMAEGTDIWAAEIVLERKLENKDIHLICALPHPGFESRRSMAEKDRFNNIIANAGIVKMVNEHYFTG